MKEVKKKIFESLEVKSLTEQARLLPAGRSLSISGLAGSMLAFIGAQIYERRSVLIIASDEDRAERIRDDCSLIIGEENVRLFGAHPTHNAQILDMTSSIARMETLKRLTTPGRIITVAFPQSVAEMVPSPHQFVESVIELKKHSNWKFNGFIAQLGKLGFEKKEFIEGYGDFAVRGGIVDVFPYIGENPIRAEFWGDTIESIREFDVLSQRSIRELDSTSIIPAFTKDSSVKSDNTSLDLVSGITHNSLFDYLQPDTLVFFDERSLIEREINEVRNLDASTLFSFEDIAKRALTFPVLDCSSLTKSQIDFSSAPQPSFHGSVGVLVESLKKYSQEGYKIYLSSDTKVESDRLQELIEEVMTSPIEGSAMKSGTGDREGTHENNRQFLHASVQALSSTEIRPTYLNETIHSGFIFHSAKLVLFTEHEIFNRLKRRGMSKRRRFKGFSQKELSQVRRGNYVVHVDHGIGVFDGLKKLTVGGAEQEVMKILFLDEDVLYVNLNFINRVQKYSSQEGHVPKLDKLGSPDWERAKAKAKKRIKDIARDLMKLYARRKSEQGFGFSPDSHWQKELEASFMYEDTPDQAGATFAVKQDMEDSSPMDRLICGDVGFGKTEVAVRAAFKAVMDGKQVCILVPTTILAIQHYNTFQDRLARYTTKVEQLTRFKSKSQQAAIVGALRTGSIDIVIGTHRLLSKDIAFKDLGLLIIDEEHRFGVTAKEKLRQLKATVDTLTLTATPIPRTLHFSLMGARDLSLINTPPRNRLPIITEVIAASEGHQSHWSVVREAIIKELHRGGQVYVVHDRVQNIDTIADQVRNHVPEARVHAAHGQMSGHELEKTMLDFLERKFDVLVATKIIESGLDIPSVNTIVINRADRFGLAELYQLRGRVGRSNVQAYAYFLVPPLSVLPKQTLRRLQAIEEFTELGSGFNLAMRDLEIRGAGNIFGAEQSGFIIEMGFEMYERVVREAVDELKSEEFGDMFRREGTGLAATGYTDTVVECDIEAMIPEFYVVSDTERLDIYRRLYRATTAEDLQEIRAELKDRFGDYPEEVEHLLILIELRQLASRCGFLKVSLKDKTVTIVLPESISEPFYGSDDRADSPFQRIMKQLAFGTLKDTRLHQQGKNLMLRIQLMAMNTASDRLAEMRTRIGEYVNVLQ